MKRSTCRLCSSHNVELVVQLEPVPLADHFAVTREQALEIPRYPVDLFMCRDCGHVQQLDVVPPHLLWTSYTYQSGHAPGMREHFRYCVEDLQRQYKLPQDSLVIDVGSNDGAFLDVFKEAGFRVLGIDPASEIAAAATTRGIPTIPEPLTESLAKSIAEAHGQAHVVTAFNVFAHADDLSGMTTAIRRLLHRDGLFVFEAQYLLDVLDKRLVATVIHEHISHHSVAPLQRFLYEHGLSLIDISRVGVQHGSIIGVAALIEAKRPIMPTVFSVLANEWNEGLHSPERLRQFGRAITAMRIELAAKIEGWRSKGYSISAYGAARSAPTLITQLHLGRSIEYIVDDHPQKVGRFSPGHGIPIVPTSELATRCPDVVIVLAWVHADRIVADNRAYLAAGGQFVTLFPSIQQHAKVCRSSLSAATVS